MGPVVWKYGHLMGFSMMYRGFDAMGPLPAEQAQFLRSMVESWQVGLACIICQTHWKKYLAEHPIDLSSATAFAQWLVQAHNQVNVLTGKPEWTFAEAQAHYMKDCDCLPFTPTPAPSLARRLGLPFGDGLTSSSYVTHVLLMLFGLLFIVCFVKWMCGAKGTSKRV